MSAASLHERLAGAAHTAPCKVCAFLRGLSPADAADWNRELAQPSGVIGHTAVVNVLRDDYQYEVSEAAVRRHRSNHRGR